MLLRENVRVHSLHSVTLMNDQHVFRSAFHAELIVDWFSAAQKRQ